MNDRFSYGVSVSRGQGVVRQEQMGSRIYWDDAETDETNPSREAGHIPVMH